MECLRLRRAPVPGAAWGGGGPGAGPFVQAACP